MNRFISAILLITLTLAISSVNVLADINHVPDDFETIQEAIDATHNLDTVLVQPGVYVENICFNGRRIVVGSLFLITGDYEFILNTIIDGNERSRVVSFIDQECRQAVLTGFTIRNGSTTYGGGIYICEANPTLKHLIVSGNSATRRAGAFPPAPRAGLPPTPPGGRGWSACRCG